MLEKIKTHPGFIAFQAKKSSDVAPLEKVVVVEAGKNTPVLVEESSADK